MSEKTLPQICKIFGNATRYQLAILLANEAHTFGSLLKNLSVNPKVLNDHLTTLISNNIIKKSYPYNVYILTQEGRLVINLIINLQNELEKIEELIRGKKEADS